MTLHTHILNENDHKFFLSQGRKDPVTGELLKVGDEIVICGYEGCSIAYYLSTWQEYKGCLYHKQPNNTSLLVPTSKNIFFRTPVIQKFIANPPQMVLGEPVVFTWSVKDATAILINNDPVLEQSSYTVYQPGVYVLRARNAKGWAENEPSIELTLASIELSFKANDQIIRKDQPIRLNWKIKNAKEATIDNGVGPITNLIQGVIDVNPKKDTVYTLTADNGFEHKTAVVSVKLPEVKIVDFRTDKQVVVPGSKLKIKWQAKHAVRYELTGYGKIDAKDELELKVSHTDDFYLELIAFGLFDEKVHKAVIPIKVANIEGFKVLYTNNTIDREYNLSWNTTGFEHVSINKGIGVVAHTGACLIPSSDQDVSYTITGRTPYGEELSQVLSLKAAKIKAFSFHQPFAYVGMQTKLSWVVDHAKRIEIDQGIGLVKGAGLSFALREEHAALTMLAFGDINIDKKVAEQKIARAPTIKSVKIPVPGIEINVNLPKLNYSPQSLPINNLKKSLPVPDFQGASISKFWKRMRMGFQFKSPLLLFKKVNLPSIYGEENLYGSLNFSKQKTTFWQVFQKKLKTKTEKIINQ